MIDFTNVETLEIEAENSKMNIYCDTLAAIINESVAFKRLPNNEVAFYSPVNNMEFLRAESVDAICKASIYYGLGYKYKREDKGIGVKLGCTHLH